MGTFLGIVYCRLLTAEPIYQGLSTDADWTYLSPFTELRIVITRHLFAQMRRPTCDSVDYRPYFMTIGIKRGFDNNTFDKSTYQNTNPANEAGSVIHIGLKSPYVSMA